MSLLAPLGLIALVTLPVIIALHFRRERLRRVAVPSLLLWQQLATNSGKQRKVMLPVTLLLLLHLLAAGLLALALAEPQWVSELLGGGTQHTVVVVDTSTSMAAQESSAATRLDRAREQVRSLVDAMGMNDTLSLVTAGAQARFITTSGFSNRAALLAALDELQATGTGTDLVRALTLAQVTLEQASGGSTRNGRVVVVSDRATPAEAALPAEYVEWVQVGETINNRAIVVLSALPRRGATGTHVYVRVANYDAQPAMATLALYGDDELITTRTLDMQGNGEAELTWELPPGIEMLRAELNHGAQLDVLPPDDVARLSLVQSRATDVLLVSDAPAVLLRALAAIPNLNLVTVSSADYSAAPTANRADLTIFHNVMPTAWPLGGVLLVHPPAGEHDLLRVEAAPAATPAEASAAGPDPVTVVSLPGTENPLDGLSLGGVEFGPLPRVEPPPWAQVLLTSDETPLVLHGHTGDSEVAIWTFDPNAGNLASKLAFPLLAARIVDVLTPPPPPASLLLGDTLEWQPNPRTERVEVRHPDAQVQQIDALDSRTLLIEGLTRPGVYQIVEYADGAPIYEGAVAVNAGTPLESDLRPNALPTTATPYIALDTSEAPAESAASRSEPQPVWPWLTLAALLVITVEWLYVHLR
jgi:hypothetical protein